MSTSKVALTLGALSAAGVLASSVPAEATNPNPTTYGFALGGGQTITFRASGPYNCLFPVDVTTNGRAVSWIVRVRINGRGGPVVGSASGTNSNTNWSTVYWDGRCFGPDSWVEVIAGGNSGWLRIA